MENETKPNRYFITIYELETTTGLKSGQINFTMGNGSFLRREGCSEWIKNTNKHLFTITNVLITNIIELSEQDYNDWMS